MKLTVCSVSVSTDHFLHAVVCCVCDAEPRWSHPVLSERPAGQLSGGLPAGETTTGLVLKRMFEIMFC